MKITIRFSDSNAAFEDHGISEYQFVLRQVMEKAINCIEGKFPLHDSNGNRIGSCTIAAE